MEIDYSKHIVDVPNYPKEGVIFKDLTPIWKDPRTLNSLIWDMSKPWVDSGIDIVASIESRGFIIGSAIAYEFGAGFVPLRKPNKLPRETYFEDFDLEYGSTSIHVHTDAVEKGKKVLIIDDLLATGGTAIAAYNLMMKLQAQVEGFGFIVNLDFLKGKEKLQNIVGNTKIDCVVNYD